MTDATNDHITPPALADVTRQKKKQYTAPHYKRTVFNMGLRAIGTEQDEQQHHFYKHH